MRVERVAFERQATPGPPALLCDPRHLEPFATVLAQRQAAGWRLFVVGWAPGAGPEREEAEIRERAAALGLDVQAAVCPHGAGPLVCWCRKPAVGLAVRLAREHSANLASSQAIATSPADRTFAARLGIPVHPAPDGR